MPVDQQTVETIIKYSPDLCCVTISVATIMWFSAVSEYISINNDPILIMHH